MAAHDLCQTIDVASRGLIENNPFFSGKKTKTLSAASVKPDFGYTENGQYFKDHSRLVNIDNYDAIWLRLPPPLSTSFLTYLKKACPKHRIVNDPDGIIAASSKAFLVNFPTITPKIRICRSMADVEAMLDEGPIVLKPFHQYGGKGIIRIINGKVSVDNQEMSFAALQQQFNGKKIEYLAMEYLKNVDQGDKRIVVVGGQIMGAALRLPADDSWLCNVAAGGTAIHTSVNADEEKIVSVVAPKMKQLGIVMYGVDTLVDNKGVRVLSELNVSSIGGLPQIQQMSGRPVIQQAINIIIAAMQPSS